MLKLSSSILFLEAVVYSLIHLLFTRFYFNKLRFFQISIAKIVQFVNNVNNLNSVSNLYITLYLI